MAGVYQGSELVTVFGGSGFVGRHVVRALARRGYRVRVAVRRPERAFFLQPLGGVGQITAVPANVRDRASVARALAGADGVVNLVGILYESGKQRFDAVHAAGARVIAEESRTAGAARLVHVSAIGAAPDANSAYFRSNAAGEAAVLAAFPEATVHRPSIQFGPEDRLFNRFAGMAMISPVVPVIGPNTRFQPVFVGDVAEAIVRSLEGGAAPGTIYELGGPEVKTFRECLELMLAEIGRKRLILALPFPLARIAGAILGHLPKRIITSDQVRQLRVDNVVSTAAEATGRTLRGLGIAPTGMAAILPTYLWRFRPKGEFGRPSLTADAERK
jgi:NADH dehydrogenase